MPFPRTFERTRSVCSGFFRIVAEFDRSAVIQVVAFQYLMLVSRRRRPVLFRIHFGVSVNIRLPFDVYLRSARTDLCRIIDFHVSP